LIHRTDIVEVARSWVGVKYHHQGRSRNGVDCVGLILAVSDGLRIGLHDIDEALRCGRCPPRGNDLLRHLRAQLIEVDGIDRHAGDVLAFWVNPKSKRPQHLGIMSDSGQFIHVETFVKRVVEQPMESWWTERIVGIFRMPGVS